MESNRKKSKIHCRVEHVFGCIKNSLKGNMIRAIGIITEYVNIDVSSSST